MRYDAEQKRNASVTKKNKKKNNARFWNEKCWREKRNAILTEKKTAGFTMRNDAEQKRN